MSFESDLWVLKVVLMVSKSQDSSGKVDGFSVDVLIVQVNRKIVRLMVSNRSCLDVFSVFGVLQNFGVFM